MPELSKRFQLLMTEEQFSFLQQLAERKGQSMGDLIREAVDLAYRPSNSVQLKSVLRRVETRGWLGLSHDFPLSGPTDPNRNGASS